MRSGETTALTFHAEFGASAIFVDEDKEDEEEHTSKPSKSNCDGHLSEREALLL